MKKMALLLSALAFTLGSSVTLATASTDDGVQNGSHILVAYFSRIDENYGGEVLKKGNTHIVAEMIAAKTHGDLFEIRTVKSYPFGYEETTDQARQEQRENARPELTAKVSDMEKYDTVFLGYPIWWSDMPMAVYTFLESYNFAGKRVIPFCTHAGSGFSRTPGNLAKALPQSEILEGLALYGTVAQHEQDKARTEVNSWLEKLGF